jgi:magnesium transporter
MAFAAIKMLAPINSIIESEHISIVFGHNFVISFQEKQGVVLTPVRERLKKTLNRQRFMNSDYLAYALIDAVVDNYFLILEMVAERIEKLEDDLIAAADVKELEIIHELKRELLFMRKAVWPLRELMGELERGEVKHINPKNKIYFRDLYDHTLQIIDSIGIYRDMVSGLLDIYLSSVSNRMNQVMKVLTVIATIFIPLSFLAGVYGMNFDTDSPFNMPELGFKYGYILFWVLVLMAGGGLLLYFRRKRWL